MLQRILGKRELERWSGPGRGEWEVLDALRMEGFFKRLWVLKGRFDEYGSSEIKGFGGNKSRDLVASKIE